VKRLFLKAAGVAVVGALLKACGGGGGGGSGSCTVGGAPTGSLTLLEVLQQDGRFSTLLAAVQNAGLSDQLRAAGTGLTLFAPTNDAFSELTSHVGGLSNGQLTDILNFHLVPRFLSSAQLRCFGAAGGERPATLYSFRGDAATLIFVNENSQLNIWDGIGRTSITLGQTDVAASNGVLHVVNDVLLPRGVLTVSEMLRANIDSFARFRAAMSASDINELDGAGPYTVFVPSNDTTGAITVRHHALAQRLESDAFPTSATVYTTLSGRTTRLTRGTTPPQSANGRDVLATLTDSTPTLANVTDVDFYGSNGVIHVLDKVLA
jgi:uncharacterized surface protein with fasciclin (FAS1) repeats